MLLCIIGWLAFNDITVVGFYEIKECKFNKLHEFIINK